jgi:hypothetical protein
MPLVPLAMFKPLPDSLASSVHKCLAVIPENSNPRRGDAEFVTVFPSPTGGISRVRDIS